MDMNTLPVADWLKYNADLQKKKNSLRKALKEKGVLAKGGENKFDHYSYFSEAQYKELFTELFSAHGLELKFSELEYLFVALTLIVTYYYNLQLTPNTFPFLLITKILDSRISLNTRQMSLNTTL